MKKLMSLIAILIIGLAQPAVAQSKQALNAEIRATIQKFTKMVPGACTFLNKTAGYIVIPNLYKAGFVVGGEYGEGGLLVKEPGFTSCGANASTFRVADYYSLFSASIGFQLGAQKRSLIIAFTSPAALRKFQHSAKWKVGVDSSVTLINVGGNMDLSTMDFEQPVVAFAFNNQGLMAGISLDGSVFTKIKK